SHDLRNVGIDQDTDSITKEKGELMKRKERLEEDKVEWLKKSDKWNKMKEKEKKLYDDMKNKEKAYLEDLDNLLNKETTSTTDFGTPYYKSQKRYNSQREKVIKFEREYLLDLAKKDKSV